MGRIAIIGTGISGLSAAYLLHPFHDVVVYEKDATVGGHSRTQLVRYGEKIIPVDTGFIVFNYKNYPNLVKLFKHLDVPVQKSVMSFGVTAMGGALEWGAETLGSVFGQRRNLLRPKFYRFLFDVLTFNRKAKATADAHPEMNVGGLLKHLGLGDWFARYYLLPMGGSIWSCTLDAILHFPASLFVRFFDAHGLLTVTQQPQWYTVVGGAREYVKRLIAPFQDKIRLSCGAAQVHRCDGKVQVRDTQGGVAEYDQVVFACHADEALSLLADASTNEREVLQPFAYQKNVAVLHKDTTIMPRRRSCWASWVYHANADVDAPISVTYWMNKLQTLDASYPLFVTLNPLRPIADGDVFDRHTFDHPIYSPDAVAAQYHLPRLQGKQNTWFCGAYQLNGFHEDGVTSAINVAQLMGVATPWS